MSITEPRYLLRRSTRSIVKWGAVVIGLAGLAACDTAYYGAMEKIGFHKRDILVDRVEEAAESQEEAKEEFKDALEQFSSVVTIEPSKLKSAYESLSDSFEDAESQAEEVTDRIDAVESVSGALFEEWESEIGLISNTKLRSSSQRQLRDSKSRYNDLIRSMRRAESRMAPVLTAFRDQVLYLKHNLNAQAISSLKSELTSIESDVGRLIREMESSIAQSQAFIEDMEKVN